MGLHLDAMLKRGFRAAKCLAFLKLTVGRIKIIRNQKHISAHKLRTEIAQLLRSGQESHAYRLKTDNLFRILNTVKAYDLIEQYCNLLSSRLQIMETQRFCPPDVKEAVATLIFAAPRCTDLQELAHIRKMFASKYGKEFVTAVAQMRPDCGVNKQIIDLLSMRPASGQRRVELMKEIAAENNIDWNCDAKFTDLAADRPDGKSGIPRPQTDSTADQGSASISSEQEGDPKDLTTMPSGGSVASFTPISSLGTPTECAAESREENVSQPTQSVPPAHLIPDETPTALASSDAIEAAETGVQVTAEVSDPESTEEVEVDFVDALETIVADSVDVNESKVDIEETVEDESVALETIVADSIDVNESKVDIEETVEDESVVVLNDELKAGPHAPEGASNTNWESVSHEDKSSRVGVEESVEAEFSPQFEIGSSKLNEAPLIPPQKICGKFDYLGSGKGRQYKDLESAAQAAFESAALAAQAAQAAFELAMRYRQEPGHATTVAGNCKNPHFSNKVYAKAEPVETPKTSADSSDSRLSESSVGVKLGVEEPKSVSEMGRISKEVASILDSSRIGTYTGSQKTLDHSHGEISQYSGDGHVVGASDLSRNSNHVSQEKALAAPDYSVGQKDAIDPEQNDDEMVNPVGLWSRKVAGARINHATDSTQEQKPKFDDEVGDSVAYGPGEVPKPKFDDDDGGGVAHCHGATFSESRKESLERTNPVWVSGQFSSSSSLPTSRKSARHDKQSPFFDEVPEILDGRKARLEKIGLREEQAATVVQNDVSSDRPNFDEESDVQLPPGAIAWGQHRDRVGARASAHSEASDFRRRFEGQPRWGSSSLNVVDNVHETRKAGEHRESRRTLRDRNKRLVPPPVEEQNEVAVASVISRKTETVDERDPNNSEQGESRRANEEQRRPIELEAVASASAATSTFGKIAADSDGLEQKNNGRSGENRRTSIRTPKLPALLLQPEVVSVTSKKNDDAEGEDVEIKGDRLSSSSTKGAAKPGAVDYELPAIFPFGPKKNEDPAAADANRQSGNSSTQVVPVKEVAGEAESSAISSVRSNKNDAETPADTKRHTESASTRVEAKRTAVEVGETTSSAASFFPAPFPPRSAPPASLPSTSSDPVALAAAPASRPPSTPSVPTTSTPSISPPLPKLFTVTSAPSPSAVKESPLGGRAHPKLPDYDSLAAQFQKLREEKRNTRPS